MPVGHGVSPARIITHPHPATGLLEPGLLLSPSRTFGGDPGHVHAVTSLSNGNQYTYDANGNQICRVEDDQTFVQTYNADCAASPQGETASPVRCWFQGHAPRQGTSLPPGNSPMTGMASGSKGCILTPAEL